MIERPSTLRQDHDNPGHPSHQDSPTTAQLLIRCGRRTFATEGVWRAPLLAITKTAGQRNRGAIHYHFGSRERLIVAILEPESEQLRQREEDLLLACAGFDTALRFRGAVEAMVRPLVELCARQPGRDHLVIVSELLACDSAALSVEVRDAIAHVRHPDAVDLVLSWLPTRTIDSERRVMWTVSFIRNTVLDWARALERRDPTATSQDPEEFIQLIVDMALAMLVPADPGPGESP